MYCRRINARLFQNKYEKYDFPPKKPKFDKKTHAVYLLIHHFSVLNSISFNISVHFSRNDACYFQTKYEKVDFSLFSVF